jgi:hypothetical protein
MDKAEGEDGRESIQDERENNVAQDTKNGGGGGGNDDNVKNYPVLRHD